VRVAVLAIVCRQVRRLRRPAEKVALDVVSQRRDAKGFAGIRIELSPASTSCA